MIACGEGQRVDLKQAICLLRRQFGIRYLLCEGGPALYSNLLELDLIDEKFLTVSPIEVGSHMPQPEDSGLPCRSGPPPLPEDSQKRKLCTGNG